MKVVFVCAGNICRSPQAEALFRHHAAFHASLQDVVVSSAGLIALDGVPAAELADQVLRDHLGPSLARHRARRLRTTEPADLVLTLDRWVHARVLKLGLKGHVELLGDYAGFNSEEVADPYDGPLEGYQVAVGVIERMVEATVSRMARERSGFDLSAYFSRIGFTSDGRADLATLRSIHLAHVTAIPFENLDIQMGRGVSLDLPTLQRKLIGGRRGGYCFEQNTILLHALRALHFDVIACEARVRPDATQVLPRTHMTLMVTLDGRQWLCDVGFGGDGLLEPLPFDAEDQSQFLWKYRLRSDGALRVLQQERDGEWADLYAFLPEARYPADFDVSNWYTSASPASRFVMTLTVQRSSPESRLMLRNLVLTRTDATGSHSREISRGELTRVLRDTFGLDVPAGARFRALDGHEHAAEERSLKLEVEG